VKRWRSIGLARHRLSNVRAVGRISLLKW